MRWDQVGVGSQGMESPILTGNITLRLLSPDHPDLIQHLLCLLDIEYRG